MSPITAFDVTYGEVLGQRGFKACVCGSASLTELRKADLNDGNATYLWAARQGVRSGEYIVAIAVVYNDEEPPAGFEKLAKNMTRGGATGAYLCFKKGDAADALAEVKVLYDDEVPGMCVGVAVHNNTCQSEVLCLQLMNTRCWIKC
jgi:hypothetical protein